MLSIYTVDLIGNTKKQFTFFLTASERNEQATHLKIAKSDLVVD